MKNKSLRSLWGAAVLSASLLAGTSAVFAAQGGTTSSNNTQSEAAADQDSAAESTDTAADDAQNDQTAPAPAATDSNTDAESSASQTVRDQMISYRFSPAVSAGTEITVTDADGKEIFSATAQSDLSMISFSVEDLADGEYTIKAGTSEDTINVSADQTAGGKTHNGRMNMGGKGQIPQSPGGNGTSQQAPSPLS